MNEFDEMKAAADQWISNYSAGNAKRRRIELARLRNIKCLGLEPYLKTKRQEHFRASPIPLSTVYVRMKIFC